MSEHCDFNESLTCPRCGFQARRRPTYRVCRPVPPTPFRPFKVGDFVERVLTWIGVTRERVERWTRTDATPGGCGCEGRKRWLNEVCGNAQIAVVRRLVRLRDFWLPA